MKLLKRQGIGTWISLATIILSIVGLAIYGAAIKAGNGLQVANASQPFYEFTRPEDAAMRTMVVVGGVLALVFLACALVLGQFKFEGIIGKVVGFVANAARIVVPALLIFVMMYFLYGSFTGIGWTFFSNEELEIAPEAVKVGRMVIAGLVFFALAAVAGAVAAFFAIRRKNK